MTMTSDSYTPQPGWTIPPQPATVVRPTLDPNTFMRAAPVAKGGNTPWAARYADTMRRVMTDASNNSARTLQRHLGPSELGADCDRQVAGKMAGIPATNHVFDPWPSVVGTAVHAWLADAFASDNQRRGQRRWVAERKVFPSPNVSGTADLYDAAEQTVGDHKVLGPTSLAKVSSPGGPSRRYRVQLHLYGLGYRNLGLPVRRIALIAWPRTESTTDNMYVWEEAHNTPEVDQLLGTVFQQTLYRRELATLLASGRVSLNEIPATPEDTECYFCPFYRPQAARDGGVGCPGTVQPQVQV